MIQLDFWNVACPECAAGIPFAPRGLGIGLQSHWMNFREGFIGNYQLRICIRGVPK